MNSRISISEALDALESCIRGDAEAAAGIPELLRELQAHGLNRVDLEVHIERLRAANDATAGLAQVEAHCLLALDLINSPVSGSLRWDDAQLASILAARCIDEHASSRAIEYSLVPSDLLPPRPGELGAVPSGLAQHHQNWLADPRRTPAKAEIVRVPKSDFTSRPAALLAYPDRVTLEAMVEWIAAALDGVLPPQVIWPRGRAKAPVRRFTAAYEGLVGEYVIKADIASFYEQVDHELLGRMLVSNWGLDPSKAAAIRHFLGAIMGGRKGLPQGPVGADLLASAYLLPMDLHCVRSGWRFARFADDYIVGCDDIDEARAVLHELEELVQQLGLRLSDEKTMIMRRATYRKSGTQAPPALQEARRQLQEEVTEALLESGDEVFLQEELTRLGVEEETLWDLLYHGTTTIEEVVESIGDRLTPSVPESYCHLLESAARRLRAGEKVEEFSASLVVEALAMVAGGRVKVGVEAMDTALTWCPRTAPSVSVYLREMMKHDNKFASDCIVELLAERDWSDWTISWLVAAADSPGEDWRGALIDRLRSIMLQPTSYPVSAVGSSRVLARAGELGRGELLALFQGVGPALQAEIVLAAMAQPSLYPGMSDGGMHLLH